MQNTQLEIRRSGQGVPPTAFLKRSRPRSTTAHMSIGLLEERPAEPFNMVAHDARNLISALYLYCELLASPGVLSPGFAHYSDDLNRLAGSGARLIESLAAGRTESSSRNLLPNAGIECDAAVANYLRVRRHPFPGIEDLAAELAALEEPLRALAGPEVRLEIECMPCTGRLALNSEDLLRILFNLVANAVEALASTPAELCRRPFVRITAQRGGAASFLARHNGPGANGLDAQTVVFSVRDNGPGIPAKHLTRIFDNGFSTNQATGGGSNHDGEEEAPRGLGLAIVRHLVSAAGGAVRAISPRGLGARFDIELPVLDEGRAGTHVDSAAGTGKRRALQTQQFSAQIVKEA